MDEDYRGLLKKRGRKKKEEIVEVELTAEEK
jgi:hypothetical protein